MSPIISLNSLFCLISALLLSTLVTGQTYSPLRPHSYPLAVRNPYLSAWLPGPNVASIAGAQPQFWKGNPLGWAVLARVDNATYSLFGVPTGPSGSQNGQLVSASYTSTRSTFTVSAGNNTQFRLEFFSPVSPNDMVKQSLPFSYLTVYASSTSGGSHDISIYSDIDDSWTGQNSSSSISLSASGDARIYTLAATSRPLYTESPSEMALWGEALFASSPSNSSTLTTGAGQPSIVRGRFADRGSLQGLNTSICTGSVTAFAHDLGRVSDETSATFAIGYTRDAAIQYLGAAQTEYWRTSYGDPISAVVAFLRDFSGALQNAESLDQSIRSSSTQAGGNNYSDITEISLRQVYGSIDLTVPQDSKSESDAKIFMKEISSSGNVNTLDVIFPSLPAFYVFNAEYIRLLLEPIVQYLDMGRWPYNYTIHDIGSLYPNATGHDDGNAEQMPIEESGNLLILAAAYQKLSGKTDFSQRYESLFRTYADYLRQNGLYPALQLSTDDGAGPSANQTNLAIKAAVALVAYGNMTQSSNYSDTGMEFANQLYNQGLGTDGNKTHFKLVYNETDSWTNTFNLYPDKLLNLGAFKQDAFDMQSDFYPTVRGNALTLSSRLDWAKTDWDIFSASIASDDTRDLLIGDVHAFLANQGNSEPFSDRFFVASDTSYDYTARPVVGGHFALLALNGKTFSSP